VEWHYLLGLISRKRRSVMIQKEDVCLQLNVLLAININVPDGIGEGLGLRPEKAKAVQLLHLNNLILKPN
jgi:hypothetical protein